MKAFCFARRIRMLCKTILFFVITAGTLPAQEVGRFEGDVTLFDGKTATSLETSKSLTTNNALRTGDDGIFELRMPDGFIYYVLARSYVYFVLDDDGVQMKLERGKALRAKYPYRDLNLPFILSEDTRVYADGVPFRAGHPAVLFLQAPVELRAIKAAFATPLPLVTFKNSHLRNKGNTLYRAVVGFDCSWKYSEMTLMLSCVIDSETVLFMRYAVPFKNEGALTTDETVALWDGAEDDYRAARKNDASPVISLGNANSVGGDESLTEILSDAEKVNKERELLHKTIYETYTEKTYAAGAFIRPTEGRISSRFGIVRQIIKGRKRWHRGLDIANETGTDVVAVQKGKVRLAKRLHVRGNCVVIDHGEGVYSSYFHLSACTVKAGSFVKKGDVIGKIGSTGFSTGPHLHWEMRAGNVCVAPLRFLATDYTFNLANMTDIAYAGTP